MLPNHLLSPEAREARALRFRRLLYRMWEESGQNQDVIAPMVNLGPKDFSRAIAPTPHPDAEQRRRFPAEQVANYCLATAGAQRFLEALLDELGYDPSRLHEIRQPTKSSAQLLAEIADKLEGRAKEDQAIREQLKLVMQEPGATQRRRR